MARRYHRKRQHPEYDGIVVGGLLIAGICYTQYRERPILVAGMIVGIIGLFVLLFWYRLYRESRHRAGLRALAVDAVDEMNGVAFERYIGALLEGRGFRQIRYTSLSNDDGIDILATKDNLKYAIQAKRYSGTLGKQHIYPVGSSYRLKPYFSDKAMVVTNSYFTREATRYAQKAGVVLVDRDELAVWRAG